jgi:hypothetical protein
MAKKGTKTTQPQRNGGAAPTHNPAEAARRELVEWCRAHRIPVPVEHRTQSNER